MAWDWTHADGDFAYPMSLDGHIFRTDLLLPILTPLEYTTPNELEEILHSRRHLVPPLMLSFDRSCVVSIPANVVTSTHRNRTGENPDWSAGALNSRLLAGDRIDLAAMDFTSVTGSHQEVPLVLQRAQVANPVNSAPPDDRPVT
jgi:hypothetical protein